MPSLMRATLERSGFTEVPLLAKSLVSSLLENGMFTQVFPVGFWDGTGTVILEPSVQVDPLFVPLSGSVTTPTSWRLALTVTEEMKITVNIATALQLQNDGTIARANWGGETKNPGEFLFLDRSHLDELAAPTYPMSYLISISDHGLFLGIWDQSTDEWQDENNYISPAFRWFVVQRPVSHDLGNVLVTGQEPVMCVYTVIERGLVALRDSVLPLETDVEINGVYYRMATAQFHRKFTVREKDVFRPSLTRPADSNSEDSGAVLNSSNQVAISEDHRYIITVPKGLNTSRYAYTHELDMIASTSADVIGHTSVVDVPNYGTEYRYKAMPANRTRNTGMRILARVVPTITP